MPPREEEKGFFEPTPGVENWVPPDTGPQMAQEAAQRQLAYLQRAEAAFRSQRPLCASCGTELSLRHAGHWCPRCNGYSFPRSRH